MSSSRSRRSRQRLRQRPRSDGQSRQRLRSKASGRVGEAEQQAARPENQLKAAYVDYIIVKRCYDAREGYAAVYINDAELSKAKTDVSSLEEKLKGPNIDLDALWTQANSLADSCVALPA